MANLELNIEKLIEKKSKQVGKRVTQNQISEGTGISQSTISRYVGNKVDRYERRILELLMEFFDCTIADLIVDADREEFESESNHPIK